MKIINQIIETDYRQAWRIINAMQTNTIFNDLLIIARLSCYLDRMDIVKKTKQYGYQAIKIEKLKKPFPVNLIPIASPYYFYLFDINLNHIYDLAFSCNDCLMFELAFIDRGNFKDLKNMLLASRNTLHHEFATLGLKCEKFFLCGFDFDDPYFYSGVSQAVMYNFIPDYLSIYFSE